MSQVFEFIEYKRYLSTRVHEVRGNLTSFAEAARCQPSYLSRVCSSKIQLTQDHAFRLCKHWGFTIEERDYFMDLVDMDRAADIGLREAIHHRLLAAQALHSNLQTRTSRPAANLNQTNIIYHSQWIYAAIHYLTSTQLFKTVSQISKRLWLSEPIVSEVLNQLEEWELVRRSGTSFEFNGGASHIAKASPVLPIFHGNWRTKATQDSQNPRTDGLHFTNLQTVSKADFERLKQIAANFVESTIEVAGPSAPEDLVVIVCDVFRP